MRVTARASHATRSSGDSVPSPAAASAGASTSRRTDLVRSTPPGSSDAGIGISIRVSPAAPRASATVLPAASTATPRPAGEPAEIGGDGDGARRRRRRRAASARRSRSCASSGPMNATSAAPRASARATSAASTPDASGSPGVPVRSSLHPACVERGIEPAAAVRVVEIADGRRSELLGEAHRGVFELALLGRRSRVHAGEDSEDLLEGKPTLTWGESCSRGAGPIGRPASRRQLDRWSTTESGAMACRQNSHISAAVIG